MTDLLESLFYVLWRGLAIGIMISAPMGPVGMLCIQRTLDKGRLTGLYTGIGAAASDLFYCLLTGFGLSFIEDFLTRNQNAIQLVGSGVLIGFAIYLLRKNPVSSLRGRVRGDTASPQKDILGGFLFTFSNPLILFLIVGLFARFNFLGAGMKWYHYTLGYISITAGALGWWWLVTYFIDRVRSHFNLRSMWLINRIIGVVIMIFGIVGLVTGISAIATAETLPPPRLTVASQEVRCWNPDRGYGGWRVVSATGDTLTLPEGEPLKVECQATAMCSTDTDGVPGAPFSLSWTLSCRGSVNGDTDISSAPEGGWSLSLTDTAGIGFAIRCLASEPDRRNLLGSSPSLTATVVSIPDSRILAVLDAPKSDCYGGLNHFRLVHDGGRWQLSVGNRAKPASTLFESRLLPALLSLTAGDKAEVSLRDMTLVTTKRAEIPALSAEETVRRLADPHAPLEGTWGILQRSLEEKHLRPGGDYRLAILADADDPDEDYSGSYTIYYIAGARKSPASWQPGMVKGRLLPTPFEDLYDVEWVDADGRLLATEIRGEVSRHEEEITAPEGTAYDDDEDTTVDVPTLTILFPYHNSTVTLRRISPR